MIVIIMIVLILCVALMILDIYFLIRNNKVLVFKTSVLHCSYNVLDHFLKSLKNDKELSNRYDEYKNLQDIVYKINSISYEKMLFSIKPLKLKYWFTESEIRLIQKGSKLYV